MSPKKLINKRLTISDVVALEPCGLDGNDDGRNYTPERIARIFSGRETLTLGDILAMDEISISDRLWVVLKRGVLPESVRVGLGCDYAERVLAIAESWAGNEGLSRLAIDVTRKWLRGEATDKERSAAALAANTMSQFGPSLQRSSPYSGKDKATLHRRDKNRMASKTRKAQRKPKKNRRKK